MAEPLLIVVYPDREKWLEARRMAICSSDAAGIMGESNWSSPVTLNYLKRGLIPAQAPDPEKEQDFDWHRRREAEIADWWWQRLLPQLPGGVVKPPSGSILWDPGDFAIAYRAINGIPWAATNDRLILHAEPLSGWAIEHEGLPAYLVPQDAIFAPVELKNAHGFMERHWQQEPPLIYLLQNQHQIMVSGSRAGYVVASLGGQPPVWAWNMRDGEILSALAAAYAMFWAAVLDNRDVGADHREVTAKAIAARFPVADGDTVSLGRDALAKWKTRCAAADVVKAYKKQYDAASNELAQLLGAAEFAKFPDGTVISYKKTKKGHRLFRRVGGDQEEAEDNGGFPF